MPDPIQIFWQPGCSSCLAAKEFLRGREVPFESVNVRADPKGLAQLEALGVRTVPVVARGAEFVMAQDLDELARFVGVVFERDRLSSEVLVERLMRLLEAARRFCVALPADALARPLPGREDRNGLSLAYHVTVIPEAFLDAVEGGELTYDYYLRMPPEAVATGADLGRCFDAIGMRLKSWASAGRVCTQDTLQTYYGDSAFETVLERTTWHVAQHARQLESLLMQAGGASLPKLGEAELGGLPLPRGVWDDEVRMV